METDSATNDVIISDIPGGVKYSAAQIAGRIARHELWLLILATPLLLLPGPWSWAGLGIILLAWLARWIAAGRLTVRTGLGPPVALLGLLAVMALLVAPDRSASQEALWRTVLGIAWFFGLANMQPDSTTLKRLSWLWVAAAAGLLLLAITGTDWQNARLFNLPLYDLIPQVSWNVQLRSLANPRGMGMALAVTAPVLFGLALMGKGRGLRLAAVLVALLLLPILALTQSLQGLLGLAFGLATLLVLWRWWTVLLVVPLVAAGLWYARQADWHALAVTALDINNPAGIGVVLRLDIWSRALAMLRDMPLTGIGLDSYQVVQAQFYPGFLLGPEIHAHNLFMQVALDLGLPGLLGVVWLLLAFAAVQARALRCKPEPGERALLAGTAAGVMAVLGEGLIDSIWTLKPVLLLWLLLGSGVLAARAVARRGGSKTAVSLAGRWQVLAGSSVLVIVLVVAWNPGVWPANLGLVKAHQALLSARSTGIPDTDSMQRARELLLAADARMPGNPQVYDELASLDAWLGDEELAIEALRTRQVMEGGNPMARYAPWEPWRRRLLGEDGPGAAADLVQVYSHWMIRYPDRAEGYARVALAWDRLAGNRTQAVAVLRDGLARGAQPAGLLDAALAGMGEATTP